MSVYRALRRRYGHRDWWPGDTPFEVMVGAVLTQNTAWSNVELAIGHMKRRGLLEPRSLARARLATIEKAVRPSGYFRQKAERVRGMARHLMDAWDGDLDAFFGRDTLAVREELLSLDGIGPEAADSMLLYAGGHPVFVIDAYTVRMCQRVGLAEGLDYHALQELFMSSLPPDAGLYNDYHAQLVELGKNHCRPRPLCGECPIRRRCDTGRRSARRAKG